MTSFRPTAHIVKTLGPDAQRKGLALLRAFRASVLREVEKSGGDAERLTSDSLREVILAAKLDLTVNQIERLCEFLSEESEGPINVYALRMHAETLIEQSGYDEATQRVLVQHVVTLLGTMVAKYGSTSRAFEMFAGSALDTAQFQALIADVSKVSHVMRSMVKF